MHSQAGTQSYWADRSVLTQPVKSRFYEFVYYPVLRLTSKRSTDQPRIIAQTARQRVSKKLSGIFLWIGRVAFCPGIVECAQCLPHFFLGYVFSFPRHVSHRYALSLSTLREVDQSFPGARCPALSPLVPGSSGSSCITASSSSIAACASGHGANGKGWVSVL